DGIRDFHVTGVQTCALPILTAQVQDLAVRAFQALGCEGWARADFMLDEQNRPWLLEMNTSPGMTSHSLVPMAAKAEGCSYAQLRSDERRAGTERTRRGCAEP